MPRNTMSLEDYVHGVVKAHITPHGATLTVSKNSTGYFLTVKKGDWAESDVVLTAGIPDDIAGEYLHCKVHALAAKVIARSFPVGR